MEIGLHCESAFGKGPYQKFAFYQWRIRTYFASEMKGESINQNLEIVIVIQGL